MQSFSRAVTSMASSKTLADSDESLRRYWFSAVAASWALGTCHSIDPGPTNGTEPAPARSWSNSAVWPLGTVSLVAGGILPMKVSSYAYSWA